MPETFNLTVGEGIPFNITSQGAWTNPGGFHSFQPGDKASTPGGTVLIADLGSPIPVRQIAFLYTNIGAGDSVRFRASLSADGMTSPLIDTSFTPSAQAMKRPSGYRHMFYHHTPGAVTARYLRIETSAAMTCGRLMFSNPLQLEYNPDFGSTSWGYDEADEGEILESGVEVLVEKLAAPVLNFTATWVSQAEMEAGWEELGRLQHEGVPVLVARRPDAHSGLHNAIYYGRLRMVPIVAAEFDMFEVQGRIRSMV